MLRQSAYSNMPVVSGRAENGPQRAENQFLRNTLDTPHIGRSVYRPS